MRMVFHVDTTYAIIRLSVMRLVSHVDTTYAIIRLSRLLWNRHAVSYTTPLYSSENVTSVVYYIHPDNIYQDITVS